MDFIIFRREIYQFRLSRNLCIISNVREISKSELDINLCTLFTDQSELISKSDIILRIISNVR